LDDFRPQAILIDFYGTVVEEIHLAVKVICDRVCALSPGKISENDFILYWVKEFSSLSQESFGVKFKLQKEIERLSLQAAIDHFKLDLNARDLAKGLIEYRSHPQLFPESKAVLGDLKLPLCLITNIDNSEIQKALNFTQLSFDFVVTSEDCRAYKPRPEVFLKALETIGLSAAEVLHVGDSWQGDIQGAQNLGIPVLWIDRRHRPLPAGVRRPDYTAASLEGLKDLLK
jgi:2-haloalkanoic acid dehalogenase type II